MTRMLKFYDTYVLKEALFIVLKCNYSIISVALVTTGFFRFSAELMGLLFRLEGVRLRRC